MTQATEPCFDVMLDIETLDTATTAAVLSIGAVAFDPETDRINTEHTFHRYLSLADQFQAGRTVSEHTVMWWFDQSDAARSKQTAAKRESAIVVLKAFALWLEQISDVKPRSVRVWGNGAAFDNATLASLYGSFGMEAPWMFWNDRCYRTLKALSNTSPSDYGVAHDALDDAVKQSHHLHEIMSNSPWKRRSA